MTELENAKPLFEFSVKLCAAVKKYKCLHDQKSHHKCARPECEDAWLLVAEECNENVDFCKNRWKSLRRCFFKGLKRRGNKYYLHDHLKFLQEVGKNPKRRSVAAANDETISTTSNSFQKKYEDNISLQGSVNKDVITNGDDDGVSVDSQTTSADESNDIMQETNQSGVFIIDEILEEADDDLLNENRLSFNRSCKRPLDPELIDKLTDEEPERKRSRKREKYTLKSQVLNKPIKIRMDKLKINLTENKVETVKSKMVDRYTHTDSKETRDFGTQYELNRSDFDNIFMKSIMSQLNEMNARQKLNFKRKIYQSLLEVFDDAADFPNGDEALLPLPSKQASCVFDATDGELHLMRELVSLVQAAKTTPEIMNAKDKVKTSTGVQRKSPLKMPLPMVDNRIKSHKSPLSVSPTPDDDDLQFLIDNVDEEDDSSLPRPWDEIKPKPTEPNKVTSEGNVVGLPRRVLQKVVRVSGPSGSTIVTRDGDKKRIYRIFPKMVNSNGNHVIPNKIGNGSGSIFVPTLKNPQDTRKDTGAGTYYITSAKNSQDTMKVSNSVSNINIRTFNNKATNNVNQTSNSLNFNSQSATSNSTSSAINNQTIFKNIHPANRVLSPTTGYFKMVPTTKSCTATSVPSAVATTSATSKVMITTLPIGPMMPPSSNVTTKRIQAVRAAPKILQRRYSICGPLSGEIPNTSSPTTTTTASKSSIPSNNGNPQVKSSISKIQISQPVSLNAKAIAPSTNRNSSSPMNSKITAKSTAHAEDIKLSPKSPKASENPNTAKNQATSATNIVTTSASTSKEHEQIVPILETAGTVEADDLDPLFVKPPKIKSEPLD